MYETRIFSAVYKTKHGSRAYDCKIQLICRFLRPGCRIQLPVKKRCRFLYQNNNYIRKNNIVQMYAFFFKCAYMSKFVLNQRANKIKCKYTGVNYIKFGFKVILFSSISIMRCLMISGQTTCIVASVVWVLFFF